MEAAGRVPGPLGGDGFALQLETDALVLVTTGRHCGNGRVIAYMYINVHCKGGYENVHVQTLLTD